MEHSGARSIQRTILVIIFAVGIVWGVSVLTHGGGAPAGRALAGGSVAVQAQVESSGVTIQGTAQDKKVDAVYVYALRRLTISGTSSQSFAAAMKRVDVRNGSFQATFSPAELKGWQASATQALKNRPFVADGVLELAVSGYPMQNFVNRDLLAASTFVGYQQ